MKVLNSQPTPRRFRIASVSRLFSTRQALPTFLLPESPKISPCLAKLIVHALIYVHSHQAEYPILLQETPIIHLIVTEFDGIDWIAGTHVEVPHPLQAYVLGHHVAAFVPVVDFGAAATHYLCYC